MSNINNLIIEIDSFLLQEQKFNNKKYYKILKDYQNLKQKDLQKKNKDIDIIFQEIEKKIKQIQEKKKL